MNNFLISVAKAFPPDVLTLIASKYRRAYEKKRHLSPEAITLEPFEVGSNYLGHFVRGELLFKEFKWVRYKLEGLLFYLKDSFDCSCLWMTNKTQKTVMYLTYDKNTDCIVCERHFDTHPEYITKKYLQTALIFLRRNGNPITGNTGFIAIDTYEYTTRKIQRKTTVRAMFYKEKEKMCSIM